MVWIDERLAISFGKALLIHESMPLEDRMQMTLPLEVVDVAVDELNPAPYNPRKMTEKEAADLRTSLERFGFVDPIVVNSNPARKNIVIGGHQRLKIAMSLGMDRVPCVFRDLDEQRERELNLRLNKNTGGWDWDLLEAFDRATLVDVGFTDEELDAQFDVDAPRADGPPIPVPAEPITQVGDLWKLGEHRLLCGDATNAEDVSRLRHGICPPLMVTDPPYGVEYDPHWRADMGISHNTRKLGVVANDDRIDWREAWALFPGSVAYCWHAGRHASSVQQSLAASGFLIRCQIIWVKDRFALSRGNYHWQHEPCWYAVRKDADARWQGARDQTTTWSIPAREDAGSGHGTQKPVECMRRPMLNNSARGDFVYDPFVGSGTTTVAAQTVGRRCLAMEILPGYCDVAVARWERLTGGSAERV